MFKFTHRWLTKMLASKSNHAAQHDGALGDKEYLLVDDRGADLTIFCFSGLAAMFGGLPSFEFGKVLTRTGVECNRVFIRDIRHMAYNIAPDGQRNGLAFYEDKVNELKAALGAKHNVALGASLGGKAALHFGYRCNMDRIIVFSPTLNGHSYMRTGMWMRTLLDVPLLLREPTAYSQTLSLLLVGTIMLRRIEWHFGSAVARTYMNAYADAEKRRPPATVFYGTGCHPDIEVADWLRTMPEINVVALPTAYHNVAGYLKRTGRLADSLKHEFDCACASEPATPEGNA